MAPDLSHGVRCCEIPDCVALATHGFRCAAYVGLGKSSATCYCRKCQRAIAVGTWFYADVEGPRCALKCKPKKGAK